MKILLNGFMEWIQPYDILICYFFGVSMCTLASGSVAVSLVYSRK